MKKIRKKNQMIITALAILVAVAGYISYTGKFAENDSELTAVNTEDANYEITEDTIFTDTEDDSVLTDDIALEETTEMTDEAALEETNEAAVEDLSQTGEETQDTNEEQSETMDEQAGEAVLTGSETAVVDYATEVKLEREQLRAQNKETLLELVNNTNLSEDQRQQAVDSMIKLTDISEREAATENLLEAKGFEDVVVSITDDSCDVVVNLEGITDAQRAQVEDIVKRKAGVSAENIVITPYQR